jgi:hypothetical protein
LTIKSESDSNVAGRACDFRGKTDYLPDLVIGKTYCGNRVYRAGDYIGPIAVRTDGDSSCTGDADGSANFAVGKVDRDHAPLLNDRTKRQAIRCDLGEMTLSGQVWTFL